MLKGVKGNGMTMGVTNGTQNGGWVATYSGSQTDTTTTASTTYYGTNISTVQPSYGEGAILGRYGITTDSTKSGIESVIDTNTNYIIKY